MHFPRTTPIGTAIASCRIGTALAPSTPVNTAQ